MLKKLTAAAVFVFLFFLCSCAQATLAPQVHVTGFEIEKNNFSAGQIIDGKITVKNYENYVMSQLSIKYQLYRSEIEGVPVDRLDQKLESEKISLSAGQEISKIIKYALPVNLPTGNFVFRVQIVNNEGEELGWDDKLISVGEGGNFVSLINNWILKEGGKLPPSAGVYYQPSQTANVVFDLKNESKYTITAYFKITTYKRNFGNDIVSSIEEAPIIIQPEELKKIYKTLPKITAPETYLSEIRLFDNSSKLPLSNTIGFRWIISGENAQILSVSPDKTEYKAGQEAYVKIQYAGPADHELGKGKAVLESSIISDKGEVVGKATQEIDYKAGQVVAKIPVAKNIDGFKITSTIQKGSKILDAKASEINYQPQPQSQSNPEKKNLFAFLDSKNFQLGAILLILATILILYFVIKIKKYEN